MDENLPVFHKEWWKSRKFWSALASSAVCVTGAAVTGDWSSAVALQCVTPVLAWLGVEGVIDALAVRRKR